MNDQAPEEGKDGGGPSLALAIAFGLMFGTLLGSVVFALTGQVLWMGIAPSFGLLAGLIYHQISNG